MTVQIGLCSKIIFGENVSSKLPGIKFSADDGMKLFKAGKVQLISFDQLSHNSFFRHSLKLWPAMCAIFLKGVFH